MRTGFGGHGYIREHGMEQFVRDARITQIYEGTNGIQAMDLVGRKLPKDGGRAVRAFFELVGREIAEAAAGDPSGIAAALEPALSDLQAATMWLAQNGMADPDNAGAGAYAYMELMGLVASVGCGSRWPPLPPTRSRRGRRPRSTTQSLRPLDSMRSANFRFRRRSAGRSKRAPKR